VDGRDHVRTVAPDDGAIDPRHPGRVSGAFPRGASLRIAISRCASSSVPRPDVRTPAAASCSRTSQSSEQSSIRWSEGP
jgi:hypothetical protein